MPRFTVQQLYIGGRLVDASSGKTFQTINPANGEVLADVQAASLADVDAAAKSAHLGQQIWAAMTAMQRSRILGRAVEILRPKKRRISRIRNTQ